MKRRLDVDGPRTMTTPRRPTLTKAEDSSMRWWNGHSRTTLLWSSTVTSTDGSQISRRLGRRPYGKLPQQLLVFAMVSILVANHLGASLSGLHPRVRHARVTFAEALSAANPLVLPAALRDAPISAPHCWIDGDEASGLEYMTANVTMPFALASAYCEANAATLAPVVGAVPVVPLGGNLRWWTSFRLSPSNTPYFASFDTADVALPTNLAVAVDVAAPSACFTAGPTMPLKLTACNDTAMAFPLCRRRRGVPVDWWLDATRSVAYAAVGLLSNRSEAKSICQGLDADLAFLGTSAHLSGPMRYALSQLSGAQWGSTLPGGGAITTTTQCQNTAAAGAPGVWTGFTAAAPGDVAKYDAEAEYGALLNLTLGTRVVPTMTASNCTTAQNVLTAFNPSTMAASASCVPLDAVKRAFVCSRRLISLQVDTGGGGTLGGIRGTMTTVTVVLDRTLSSHDVTVQMVSSNASRGAVLQPTVTIPKGSSRATVAVALLDVGSFNVIVVPLSPLALFRARAPPATGDLTINVVVRDIPQFSISPSSATLYMGFPAVTFKLTLVEAGGSPDQGSPITESPFPFDVDFVPFFVGGVPTPMCHAMGPVRLAAGAVATWFAIGRDAHDDVACATGQPPLTVSWNVSHPDLVRPSASATVTLVNPSPVLITVSGFGRGAENFIYENGDDATLNVTTSSSSGGVAGPPLSLTIRIVGVQPPGCIPFVREVVGSAATLLLSPQGGATTNASSSIRVATTLGAMLPTESMQCVFVLTHSAPLAVVQVIPPVPFTLRRGITVETDVSYTVSGTTIPQEPWAARISHFPIIPGKPLAMQATWTGISSGQVTLTMYPVICDFSPSKLVCTGTMRVGSPSALPVTGNVSLQAISSLPVFFRGQSSQPLAVRPVCISASSNDGYGHRVILSAQGRRPYYFPGVPLWVALGTSLKTMRCIMTAAEAVTSELKWSVFNGTGGTLSSPPSTSIDFTNGAPQPGLTPTTWYTLLNFSWNQGSGMPGNFQVFYVTQQTSGPPSDRNVVETSAAGSGLGGGNLCPAPTIYTSGRTDVALVAWPNETQLVEGSNLTKVCFWLPGDRPLVSGNVVIRRGASTIATECLAVFPPLVTFEFNTSSEREVQCFELRATCPSYSAGPTRYVQFDQLSTDAAYLHLPVAAFRGLYGLTIVPNVNVSVATVAAVPDIYGGKLAGAPSSPPRWAVNISVVSPPSLPPNASFQLSVAFTSAANVTIDPPLPTMITFNATSPSFVVVNVSVLLATAPWLHGVVSVISASNCSVSSLTNAWTNPAAPGRRLGIGSIGGVTLGIPPARVLQVSSIATLANATYTAGTTSLLPQIPPRLYPHDSFYLQLRALAGAPLQPMPFLPNMTSAGGMLPPEGNNPLWCNTNSPSSLMPGAPIGTAISFTCAIGDDAMRATNRSSGSVWLATFASAVDAKEFRVSKISVPIVLLPSVSPYFVTTSNPPSNVAVTPATSRQLFASEQIERTLFVPAVPSGATIAKSTLFSPPSNGTITAYNAPAPVQEGPSYRTESFICKMLSMPTATNFIEGMLIASVNISTAPASTAGRALGQSLLPAPEWLRVRGPHVPVVSSIPSTLAVNVATYVWVAVGPAPSHAASINTTFLVTSSPVGLAITPPQFTIGRAAVLPAMAMLTVLPTSRGTFQISLRPSAATPYHGDAGPWTVNATTATTFVCDGVTLSGGSEPAPASATIDVYVASGDVAQCVFTIADAPTPPRTLMVEWLFDGSLPMPAALSVVTQPTTLWTDRIVTNFGGAQGMTRSFAFNLSASNQFDAGRSSLLSVRYSGLEEWNYDRVFPEVRTLRLLPKATVSISVVGGAPSVLFPGQVAQVIVSLSAIPKAGRQITVLLMSNDSRVNASMSALVWSGGGGSGGIANRTVALNRTVNLTVSANVPPGATVALVALVEQAENAMVAAEEFNPFVPVTLLLSVSIRVTVQMIPNVDVRVIPFQRAASRNAGLFGVIASFKASVLSPTELLGIAVSGPGGSPPPLLITPSSYAWSNPNGPQTDELNSAQFEIKCSSATPQSLAMAFSLFGSASSRFSTVQPSGLAVECVPTLSTVALVDPWAIFPESFGVIVNITVPPPRNHYYPSDPILDERTLTGKISCGLLDTVESSILNVTSLSFTRSTPTMAVAVRALSGRSGLPLPERLNCSIRWWHAGAMGAWLMSEYDAVNSEGGTPPSEGSPPSPTNFTIIYGASSTLRIGAPAAVYAGQPFRVVIDSASSRPEQQPACPPGSLLNVTISGVNTTDTVGSLAWTARVRPLVNESLNGSSAPFAEWFGASRPPWYFFNTTGLQRLVATVTAPLAAAANRADTCAKYTSALHEVDVFPAKPVRMLFEDNSSAASPDGSATIGVDESISLRLQLPVPLLDVRDGEGNLSPTMALRLTWSGSSGCASPVPVRVVPLRLPTTSAFEEEAVVPGDSASSWLLTIPTPRATATNDTAVVLQVVGVAACAAASVSDPSPGGSFVCVTLDGPGRFAFDPCQFDPLNATITKLRIVAAPTDTATMTETSTPTNTSTATNSTTTSSTSTSTSTTTQTATMTTTTTTTDTTPLLRVNATENVTTVLLLATIPPIIVAEPIQAASDIGSGSTTATAVSALIASNPAAAQQAARASLLVSLARRCVNVSQAAAGRSGMAGNDTFQQQVDRSQQAANAPGFPTAILPMVGRIGTWELWAAHRAVIFGNSVFAIAVVVGILLAAVVRGPLWNKITFRGGLRLVRWPGILLLPVGLVSQGMIGSAFFLLLTAGSPGSEGFTGLDGALGVIVAVIAVAAIGAMTHVTKWAVTNGVVVDDGERTEHTQEDKWSPDGSSTGGPRPNWVLQGLRNALGMQFRWTTTHQGGGPSTGGEEDSTPSSHETLLAYGSIFEKYYGPAAAEVEGAATTIDAEGEKKQKKGATIGGDGKLAAFRRHWSPSYTLIDFACLIVCAIADGASAADPLRTCTASSVVSALVNVASLIIAAVLRPFLSPAKNVLCVVSSAISALGAVLLLGAITSPKDNLVDRMVDWAAMLASVSAVVSCVTGTLSFIQRLVKWLSAPKEPPAEGCQTAGDASAAEPRQRSKTFIVNSASLDAGLLSVEDQVRLTECTAANTTDDMAPDEDDVGPSQVVATSDAVRWVAEEEEPVNVAAPVAHGASGEMEGRRGRVLDDSDDEDDETAVPANQQRAGRALICPERESYEAALSAMTTTRADRQIRRTAEGQARFDELHALLSGGPSAGAATEQGGSPPNPFAWPPSIPSTSGRVSTARYDDL